MQLNASFTLIKILPLILAIHPEFDKIRLGAFDRRVVIAGEFADYIGLRIWAGLADADVDALRLLTNSVHLCSFVLSGGKHSN